MAGSVTVSRLLRVLGGEKILGMKGISTLDATLPSDLQSAGDARLPQYRIPVSGKRWRAPH